jgi:hypothetical protein
MPRRKRTSIDDRTVFLDEIRRFHAVVLEEMRCHHGALIELLEAQFESLGQRLDDTAEGMREGVEAFARRLAEDARRRDEARPCPGSKSG